MKIFSTICLALLLVACSSGDPHDTKVPTDVSKWSSAVKPSLQKLTREEKILFSQYAIRHTVGADADPIPQDMTIGRAIEEQRNYIAGQSKDKTHKEKSGT